MNFLKLFGAASRGKDVYVTIAESPHWGRQGSRWLAHYFSKFAESYANVIVLAKDISDWEYSDVKVISWSDFREKDNFNNILIVYSVSHHCKFAAEIEGLGCYFTFDATAFNIDRPKISGELVFDSEANILDVYSLIKDSQSKNLYMQMLYARVFGDLQSIKPSNYPIYFNPYFVLNKFKPGSIIIDGGSFDGNESVKLRDFYSTCLRVDSYEFDVDNYFNNLSGKVYEKIVWINKGLWSKSGFANSSGAGIATRVNINNQSGQITGTPLVAIDHEYSSDEWIGLIKLDIEGAEIEAINGAADVIRRCKPILLFSIYHRLNDIWEVPLLVNSIQEGYSFRIGQHDKLLSETLLYAEYIG